jgi:hypothetical protein
MVVEFMQFPLGAGKPHGVGDKGHISDNRAVSFFPQDSGLRNAIRLGTEGVFPQVVCILADTALENTERSARL